MNDLKTVTADSTIQIRYVLSLADGTVIEEASEEAEMITLGQGDFINELEQKLYGRKAGDADDIIIPAIENLFGAYDEERVQNLSTDAFEEGEPPVAGHVIEFTLPNGVAIPGIIREVKDDRVVVDFNHPLCGKDIMFSFEIVSIE